VTTPLANVGHAPLGVGRCVGSLPPLEPPDDEDEASPPLLEPASFEPLLEPLDDPEPLDELPPLELVLPELPPLLDDPLEPPSPRDDDAPPELPQAIANPAPRRHTDNTSVFMATPD
jgi:hypothetical protein